MCNTDSRVPVFGSEDVVSVMKSSCNGQEQQKTYCPKGNRQAGRGICTCPVLQVLLLGEANFSFALALRLMLEPPSVASMPCDKAEEKAREELYHERLRLVAEYFGLPPQPSRQWKITATCYERYMELVEKYPESDGILSRLWNFAVDVSPLLSFIFESLRATVFSI